MTQRCPRELLSGIRTSRQKGLADRTETADQTDSIRLISRFRSIRFPCRFGCLKYRAEAMAAVRLTPNESPRRFDELVDRQPEPLVDVRVRRRRAEMVDPHDDAVASDPPVPGHRVRRLDRHPLGP